MKSNHRSDPIGFSSVREPDEKEKIKKKIRPANFSFLLELNRYFDLNYIQKNCDENTLQMIF